MAISAFLIVEDNDLDFEAVERAFRALKVSTPLQRARDGYEALGVLRGEDGAPRLTKPFIVLLDVNMPKMNGLEFLREIRADPTLCDTRVVMLTTSDRRADVEEAYKHQAAGYIVKPVTRDRIVAGLSALHEYWSLCESPVGA